MGRADYITRHIKCLETKQLGASRSFSTRQIKCLEKQLGVMLFDRSTGTMKLTAEGKILRDKVIILFDYLQEIQDEFNKEPREYQGRIVIAATPRRYPLFSPPYIASFSKTHPCVSFNIAGSLLDVYEKVESGEADFGIGFADAAPNTMVCHDLFETGQMLIAPKGNPFFPGRHPTLKQIAASPLSSFPGPVPSSRSSNGGSPKRV